MTADPMPREVGDAGLPDLTLRDYFAAHAPIHMGSVLAATGFEHSDLFTDDRRAAIFACWAELRYEYADAMLRQRAAQAETQGGGRDG